MKKRYISLFLALSILCSLVVAPATAVESSSKTAVTEKCNCGCDQTFEEVTWQPWRGNEDTDVGSGHYYLESDYTQYSQIVVNSGIRVVIDLRGYELSNTKDSRMVLCYGYMAVMDSVGGGRLCSNTTGSGFGGVIMVATNETLNSVFELYSGTLTLGVNHKGSRRGGLITVGDTCIFRMYGGTVLNGTTYSMLDAYKDTKDDAGCIYGASGSVIEILGGKIIGGKSDRYGGNIYAMGTTVLKNCEMIGGYAEHSGGNICQNGGSLTIENAVIRDGVCEGTGNGGGNICLMSGAVLNIKDSTLRNGYSNYHGGNLYMGSCSGTIENTVIEAGVAANRGGNVYGASSAKGLVIRNCALPGNVAYVGKDLTLEGKVTIGLLNYGLRLGYGSDKANVIASGLAEGSEIFVTAQHTFADSSANISYFKGANRTVLTQTEEGLTASYAASGELGGYCPHCNQRVAWTLFDTTNSKVQNCLLDSASDTDPSCTGRHIESGHYYLGASLTGMAQHYIGVYLSGQGTLAIKDVVLDMSGYSLTASGRVFYVRPGIGSELNSLTILDSYGSSKLTGSGASNQGGGVLYNEGGRLMVYGGSYVYKPASGRNVTTGGVIQGGYENYIHGGVFDGRAFAYTDASTTEKTYKYNGGVLSLGDGANKNLIMTAGVMLGGTANQGGCFYGGYNNNITITAGHFRNGQATLKESGGGIGGNIRLEGTSTYKSGVAQISGVAITGGYSESNAGNFSGTYYKTLSLSDSYIADGKSKDYGGNIAIGANSTFANYENLIINQGSAHRGANLYCAGTGSRANIIGCYVTDGAASGYGGNFYAGNGYLVIKGGVFDHGRAATYGGNLVANCGKTAAANYLKIEKDDEGNVPQITGGVAATYGGNLYVSGVLELRDAFIRSGKAKAGQGQDIWYLASTSSHKAHGITVGAGLAGDIVMGTETGNLTAPYYALAVKDTVCNVLNANITLENVENNPMLAAKDGQLYVGSVAVFNGAGECTWYASNEDAMEACGEGEYVKLFVDGSLALTKDCPVDLNGHSLTVTGGYTLMGMDSASQGGADSAGKAILGEETGYTADHFAPDGVRYLAIAQGQEVTWHTLDMSVTSIALRPATAGMYYQAVWNLDSTLKSQVSSYGIALSVVAMPGSDFKTDETVLYTVMDGATLVAGTPVTSAIIDNIFTEDGSVTVDGEEITGALANQLRGQQMIYAMPYAVLQDGTVYTPREGAAWSLRQLLQQLGESVEENPEQYRKYTPDLRAFYTAWADKGLETYGLENMYAFYADAEDDVLDILMIGNSYCYYYVEELHEMAKAAGVKLRVCNLYYSGCDMNQHYPWWKTGQKKYQYFEAVDGGKVKTNGVSLEWALMQREWDVLTFQLSSSETREYSVDESLALHREARNAICGYLREQFPTADLYFHQVWSYEIGHTRDGGYVMKDLEQQMAYTEHIRQIATGVCAENNVQRINTGDAWELYRAACDAAGIAHNLTARLGKDTLTGEPHSGDGTHDGDIGGGQLLNAYVWYEILTGLDCRESTFVPTYTYNGQTYTLDATMVSMLQEAAHKAVTEIRPTYPENIN